MLLQETFTEQKDKWIQENDQKYGKEIRAKYGNDTVDQSHVNLRAMPLEDYAAMAELGKEILDSLSQAYITGDTASDVAQETAAKHKQWLMYLWSCYSEDAHANLADKLVTDKHFAQYYNQHVEGGAEFLRQAILIFLSD